MRGGDATTTDLKTWLSRLRAELPEVAQLELSPAETGALLDLARVAAHGSERIAAPITTFLAGVALRDLPADERLRRIRELVLRLSPEDS